MTTLDDLHAVGFWRRVGAMIRKEFIQLRRDRITFATMITIPLFQLLLFGYAINTTPRDLPTAVLLQETSDIGRSILKAIENTRYFKITHRIRDAAEFAGPWHGRGAEMLGLSGTVDKESYFKLCDNINPKTGEIRFSRLLLRESAGGQQILRDLPQRFTGDDAFAR